MNDSDFAIIFVPGIRPKPPVALHSLQLRRCLQAGLRSAACSADRAARLAANFEVAGWSHQFYGTDGDISVDLAGIDRLLAGRDSRAADKQAAGALPLRINSILYAIGDRFPLLTKLFGTRLMRSRVREIQQYFADRNGTGATARAIVIDALQRAWLKGQRVLLVAHSFGSVIAYDALWQLSREHGNPGQVDLLLSLGSPLTMRYIRRRLLGAQRSGTDRYPANIRYWANLAAIGEATALDRRLSVCFAAMVRFELVAGIDDNLQLVNQFHGPAGLNVHKCYGYLANPEVAAQLLAAIERAAT